MSLAYASKHEDANGIINHWFIIDWHELLADAFSDWIEARTTASGENNSFHGHKILYWQEVLNLTGKLLTSHLCCQLSFIIQNDSRVLLLLVADRDLPV